MGKTKINLSNFFYVIIRKIKSVFMSKVNQLFLTTAQEIDGFEIYEQTLVIIIFKFISI